MKDNLPALLTSIIFIIVGVVSILQPYRVKVWMNKGNEKTLDSNDNKVYFILVRVFGIVALCISVYVIYRLQ